MKVTNLLVNNRLLILGLVLSFFSMETPLLAMEELDAEGPALRRLKAFQQMHFETLVANSETKLAVLYFLEFFRANEEGWNTRNYFGEVLDLISLEENSHLTFFTQDVFEAVKPVQKMTKSETQKCVKDRIEQILEALENTSPTVLRQLIVFFADEASRRTCFQTVRDLIYWFKLLNTSGRPDLIERMVPAVDKLSRQMNSPLATTGPLYKSLSQIEDPDVRAGVLSIILKAPLFWQNVNEKLTTEIIPGLAKLSPEECVEIEAFFTPQVVEIVKKRKIYFQVLDRLVRGITRILYTVKWGCPVKEINYADYTRAERQVVMASFTTQFLERCPVKGFSKLTEHLKDITPRKVEQVSSLLRPKVKAQLASRDIVRVACKAPISEHRRNAYVPLSDADRDVLLPLLTDEFFEYVRTLKEPGSEKKLKYSQRLDYIDATIKLLRERPFETHSFIMTFLMHGFSHEWVKRIIGFGSYEISPPPQFKLKHLLFQEDERKNNERVKDEDRLALLNFLMRLNGLGIQKQDDIEAILGNVCPPYLGSEAYYLDLTKPVLDFLSEDILRTLQSRENVIRFITLVYNEPTPYLDLTLRACEEVIALIAFLSPDKLLDYTTAEGLLNYVKNLRYKDETFHPAMLNEKADLNSAFTRYKLENRPHMRWFFEDNELEK
jgi:hypothetical protein